MKQANAYQVHDSARRDNAIFVVVCSIQELGVQTVLDELSESNSPQQPKISHTTRNTYAEVVKRSSQSSQAVQKARKSIFEIKSDRLNQTR